MNEIPSENRRIPGLSVEGDLGGARCVSSRLWILEARAGKAKGDQGQ